MKRRDFLANASALAALSSLPSAAKANLQLAPEPQKYEGLSILQGVTTKTTTQLSVDVPVEAQYEYTLKDIDTNKLITPESYKPVSFGNSDTRVDKLRFIGLELGHTYNFIVKDIKTNEIVDDRFLQTVDLNKTDARIGLFSCMNDSKSAVDDMWPSAEAADLDYMFFIGDSVYGDLWIFYGPERLWKRYIETRSKIPYYHWKNLKPVIGIWDDHDYGKNNEGGYYKHKDNSLFAFKTFFAQDPEGGTFFNGYANSSFFHAFEQNFVFFDSRYYREMPNTNGSLGFLGDHQIDWMSKAVYDRPYPTMVINGSPAFGRIEKGSSYQSSAPEEFEYFIKKVQSWNTPCIFAGGDLHYSEVSSIDKSIFGYNSYEIISSCMHSNTKTAFLDNPNETVGGFLKENFVVVQNVGGRGLAPNWKLTCVGKDKAIPFSLDLKIS